LLSNRSLICRSQLWLRHRGTTITFRFPISKRKGSAGLLRAHIAVCPRCVLAPDTKSCAPAPPWRGSVPVVFVNTSDPVGAGFVDSLGRPGGNVTGFTQVRWPSFGWPAAASANPHSVLEIRRDVHRHHRAPRWRSGRVRRTCNKKLICKVAAMRARRRGPRNAGRFLIFEAVELARK
jgi:hypothetical protein